MPTVVTHLTDRDRHDLAVCLRLSVRDDKDEAALFRARQLARKFDLLDLFDAHVRPQRTAAGRPKK